MMDELVGSSDTWDSTSSQVTIKGLTTKKDNLYSRAGEETEMVSILVLYNTVFLFTRIPSPYTPRYSHCVEKQFES